MLTFKLPQLFSLGAACYDGGCWWPVVTGDGEMAAKAEEALLSVCIGLALLVMGLPDPGFSHIRLRPGCQSWGSYSRYALGKTSASCPPLPQTKLGIHSQGAGQAPVELLHDTVGPS